MLHVHLSSGVVRNPRIRRFFGGTVGVLVPPPAPLMIQSRLARPPGGLTVVLPRDQIPIRAPPPSAGTGCCCPNSREDSLSNVPEFNICVTAIMVRLCSDTQFHPSSAIWDGSFEGLRSPLSMLPRPNRAAVVSLSFLPRDT
jgi:hypothetical protein